MFCRSGLPRRRCVLMLALLGAALLVCAEARAETLLMSDSFTTTYASLEGKPIELGGVSWRAALHGMQSVSGVATNSDVAVPHIACVEFEPSSYEDFDAFSVEAVVYPNQATWVGVGFSQDHRFSFDSFGALWAKLTPTGRLIVYSGPASTANELYDSVEETGWAAPGFSPGNNKIRIRYLTTDKSVRVWLNDTEMTLTVAQLGNTPNIKWAGFQGHCTDGCATTGAFSFDDFKVSGHIPPGEPLIEDTFTNSSPDRDVDDTLEGLFTEVGPQRWQTNGKVVFGDGKVKPVIGHGDAIASVGIEPDEYPEYHVIRLEATIDPTGSTWTGLLFRSGPLDPAWTNRQLFVNLLPHGRVKVRVGDWPVYDSIDVDPAFQGGPNRVRIDFDRYNRYVAVFLNGTELEIDPVYLGYEDPTICFAPDIHWAGFHARHDTGFESERPTIDDFRISLRGKVHGADSFTNSSPNRDAGDALNGAPVQITPTPAIWSGKINSGFGEGHATNLAATGDVAAGLPLRPAEILDHRTFRVEAMVDSSQVDYTCLGFKANAMEMCWSNRQLQMTLHGDGRIAVRGNGNALPLYSDSQPNPAVILGAMNHLVVEYDQLDKSARAWVNGVELGLNLAPLASWQPNINSAGFSSIKSPDYGGPGKVKVDDFVVTLADTIPPLVPDPLPSHRYAEEGDAIEFVCGASGGVKDYSFLWHYKNPDDTFTQVSDDGGRITGIATSTMTITSVEAGDDQKYSCRVTDSDPRGAKQEYSTASELIIMNVTPSEDCINESLAPGNFTNHPFFPNNFDDWVANGPGWTNAGTHALVETSTDDLLITRSAVPIPAEAEGVRLVFGGISTGGGLQVRFCWGPDDCSAHFVAVSNGETDIMFGTSWYQGTPVDGYYTRDLTVEFVTDYATAELQRIDLMQGPRLILRIAPSLTLPDNQVPIPHNYVQGTEMEVHQKVKNQGCPLSGTGHDALRPISFSLCKPSGECWNEGFSCSDGNPPDDQIVAGSLGEGQELDFQLCTLTLPAVPEGAISETWLLRSQLEYYDNEFKVFEFSVYEHGTPNLKLANVEPVEAHDVSTFERIDWVERGVPFKVGFTLVSEQWSSENVDVVLKARATAPGATPSDDWEEIASTEVAEVDWTGVVLDVTIGADFPPIGEDLALLDLKILIDPYEEIGEFNEDDNAPVIESWIPLTSDPLDQLGTQISSLVDDFDTTGPMATFMSDRVLTDMDQGTLRVRYEPDDPASGEVPYLAWSVVSEEPVSGVMVRILQTTNDDAPDLFAGAGGGAFDPALDSPPDLAGATSPYVADDQWHTLIWRKGEQAPFGSYAGLVQLADVTTSGASIGGVPCDSGNCQTLVLALDTDCAYETSCPTSFIDFVRTWTDPASVQVDGLEATGFTYSADGQIYAPIEPGQEIEIAAGAQIYLQAVVTNQGDPITGSVTLEAVDASMSYTGGPVETLGGQLTVSNLSTGEQAFINLGSHTVAQSAGTVALTFTLQTSVGEVSEPTATAEMTVVIPAGCIDPGIHATGVFADVDSNHWAYDYIKRVSLAGYMNGCGGDSFCPSETVSRAEMAMFMERYMRDTGFVPSVPLLRPFEDVPLTSELACWVELAKDDLSSGCGGGNYCPDRAVNRAENSVFLLRAREHVAHDGHAPPPPCDGLFLDLPCTHWAAPWAEELDALGVVPGCGGGNYCPSQTITRAELAEYLCKLMDSVAACTFQLDLPVDLTEAR